MTEHRPLTTTPTPVRLRVEDYLLLDRAGAFDGYHKTELLAGEIFYMNAQHRPHAYAKSELAYRLRRALEALDAGLAVLMEASVAMPPVSAPEPDIIVTDEPRGPGLVPLASVKLLVEVADTTLHGDLTRKAGLYAEAGVPEYWVVDIGEGVIHRLWMPGGRGYADQDEVRFGSPVAAATLPGLSVETNDL